MLSYGKGQVNQRKRKNNMNSISFFKALLMKEMDEELKGGQKKLDVAEPKGKITGADFKALRAKKGMKKEMNTPNPPTDYSGKPAIPGMGAIVDMEEGELKLGVKYDLDGDSGYISTGGSKDPKDWKFLADKGKYPYLSVKKKLVPSAKQPTKYGDAFKAGSNKGHYIDENEDHEVSMAHNSLESIIKSAMELKMKLGDNEKDIPAWIQDHITNAENYINQASKNYHEYSSGESDFDELPDGTEELPAGDEEDAAMSLKDMMENFLKSKKEVKEEAGDWEEGFEWMDELPKQYGNWKIDIADDSVGFDDQPIVWYYKGDENGYRVVYTPNDYYATEIRMYAPGQDMYDSDEEPVILKAIEFGEELEDFSFEKYVKYGVGAIKKAEQIIQKAGK